SLKALAQQEGATLFMIGLAALDVLLCHYTGQQDILIGTPILNRGREEVKNLMGFFTNTLVMRADLSGNPTFRELIRQVRETAIDAYSYQELPFEKLVEELRPQRDLSRTPLFQVSFSSQIARAGQLDRAGLKLVPMPVDLHPSKFDLELSLIHVERRLKGVI